MKQSLQHYAQLAAIVIVVIGCFQVLHPFIPAILFSAVACSSSWPMFAWLRKALGGRPAWAALLMTMLWIVLIIGPITALAAVLADEATDAARSLKELLERGPLMPPAWLAEIPFIGGPLDGYWRRLVVNRDEVANLLRSLFEPAKNVLLGTGKTIGTSLLQMVLAAFIGFFFYRDGEALLQAIRKFLQKLSGDLGDTLLLTINHTVAGVVYGIFGTALAQSTVAVVGFLIAGVPGALALATATFFLSMIPIGPPLVWIGATIWLYRQESMGWAIFMVLWGLFAISSIDNFVKPYLISRRSSLPLLVIVFGVFGGIAAFGFIGIFIGPPVLAVGLTLINLWIAKPSTPSGGP